MGHRHNPDDERFERIIGMQIQLWRERRGLTALALAELAGVHRNTIYRLECGKGCGASLLVRVMLVLEIQMKDLNTDAQPVVHSYKSAIVEYGKPARLPFGTPN